MTEKISQPQTPVRHNSQSTPIPNTLLLLSGFFLLPNEFLPWIYIWKSNIPCVHVLVLCVWVPLKEPKHISYRCVMIRRSRECITNTISRFTGTLNPIPVFHLVVLLLLTTYKYFILIRLPIFPSLYCHTHERMMGLDYIHSINMTIHCFISHFFYV